MEPKRLRANTAAAQQLKDKLARLELRPAQGSAASPLSAKVLNRKYVFPANDQKIESLGLTSTDAGRTLTLTARTDGKDMTIPCGYQQWKKGHAPLFGGRLAQFPDEPTAGTFAWSADDTCLIKSCAYETPYHTALTLKFDGDQLALDSETNVSFGPAKRPQLIGRVE
jgi:hypothetical protein